MSPLRGLCGPAEAVCACTDGVRLEFVDSLRLFVAPHGICETCNGSTISSNSLRLCDHPLGLSQHFDARLCFSCQHRQAPKKRWRIRPLVAYTVFWCRCFLCGFPAFRCFLWCVQESYAFSRLGDHFRPPCRDFCESLRLCNDPYREF